MDYAKTLKTLRAKLLESATGKQAPAESGIESLIPTRMNVDVQPEPSDDILAKSAEWLGEIRQASRRYKEAREASRPKGGKESPVAMVLKTVTQAIEGRKDSGTTEETPKESFIARRSSERPSTYAPDVQNLTKPVKDAEMSSVLDAIAAVESRGSGDYEAVGPVVKKGMYKGQRAYGRYQVMEGNIPAWSKEALGRSVSLEEFRSSPSIQDAIAAHQLQKAKNRYGTWDDAASVWFSGRPMSKAGNVSDGYTTVPEYVAKFRKNL